MVMYITALPAVPCGPQPVTWSAAAEVNPNGLVYIDVKEGGTVLELLGPPIHNMVMGTVLKGMEGLINTPLPPVG